MDVIGEGRFLTSIREKSRTKWSIKHFLHCISSFLPLHAQFFQQRFIYITSPATTYNSMQFTQKFLDYMEFCLPYGKKKVLKGFKRERQKVRMIKTSMTSIFGWDNNVIEVPQLQNIPVQNGRNPHFVYVFHSAIQTQNQTKVRY